MPRITISGLDMDAQMFGRIVAAVRGLFPQLVGPGDSDYQVIQIVIKYFATEWIATWEARQAAPDSAEVADVAIKKASAARREAEAAAREAAKDIKLTTPPGTSVP